MGLPSGGAVSLELPMGSVGFGPATQPAFRRIAAARPGPALQAERVPGFRLREDRSSGLARASDGHTNLAEGLSLPRVRSTGFGDDAK